MRTRSLAMLLALPALIACSDGDGGASADARPGPTDARAVPADARPGSADARPGPADAGDCTAPLPICDPSSLLVDGTWLEQHLEDREIQIIDVRDAASYATGRVPGAARVGVTDLLATVDGVSSQVAKPETVAQVLGEAGVTNGVTAVVYGHAVDTTAARLFWTLEYYGHTDVRLLDGGYGAWQDASHPIETDSPGATAGDYSIAAAVEDRRVDADWIVARLDDPEVMLVDARTAGEYADGHIPGALNVSWQEMISDGSFRPYSEVGALYAAVPPNSTVVAYCRTGARASATYFALRWLGYADVRLYDGSWSEWGSDPTLPREP